MNAYEYGQVLRANIGQDVSEATSYAFILQPKIGASKNSNASTGQPKNAIVRTGSDVTLGTSTVTVDDQTYYANQYIEYTVKANDLSHSGLWRIKGEAIMSASEKISGDFKNLTVLD